MTAGTRRSGLRKLGIFRRGSGTAPQDYTGRHATPPGKAARTWRSRKAVPAAAAVAAVALGTAAYALASGTTQDAAQATAAMTAQSRLDRSSHPGAGVGSAAAAVVNVAATTANDGTRAPASPAASPPATRKPAAAASTAPSTPAARPASTKPAAPAPAATHKPAAATTLSCNLGYSLLPQNVTAIVGFLLAHGYTHNAAAGIAGNIYQESKGNPESVGMGGGGLIGWTPLPSGYVTGNLSADLQTQLNAVLTYNQGWSQYIPALNAATSPASAAAIYVTDFERAGIPAASTREASAANVATACGL